MSSFPSGNPDAAMAQAGGSGEMAAGYPCLRGGVERDAAAADGPGCDISVDACRVLGRASGTRKRRAAVMPTESVDSMGNEEDSDLVYENLLNISYKQTENLSSEMVWKRKEFLYIQKIKHARAENDELKVKNEGLKNNIVEILENHNEEKKKLLLEVERLKKIIKLAISRRDDEIRKLREGKNKACCCTMNHQTCSTAQATPHGNVVISGGRSQGWHDAPWAPEEGLHLPQTEGPRADK
ncbi:hypothetical protein ACP4OV_022318 [Aristida adscensionis]